MPFTHAVSPTRPDGEGMFPPLTAPGDKFIVGDGRDWSSETSTALKFQRVCRPINRSGPLRVASVSDNRGQPTP